MKKNVLALLLGLGFSIILLSLVEVFFQINATTHWLKKPVREYSVHIPRNDTLSQSLYETFKNEPSYQWKPLISEDEANSISRSALDVSQKGNLPCCMGKHHPVPAGRLESKVSTGEDHRLVYSVHFTFDSHGRRLTPVNPRSQYNILMFGDSYTLGEGVDDEQSAPYQLAKMRPEAQVYNFGISGGGANDVLYELQDSKKFRLSDISKKKSIVLYSYMDDHLERLFARSIAFREETSWLLIKPYYALENGKVVFKGFFDRDRAAVNTFYKIWNSSATLSFFDVPWPPKFTQKHFDFFGDILKSIQASAKKNFGEDTDFYFVLYPGASDTYGARLKMAAQARGLKVLDYNELDMYKVTGGNPRIPVDRHPSPVTQFVFASLLNKDLHLPSQEH